MKSKQKKWEILLEDTSLELRIRSKAAGRYQKEQNRNRVVGGFVLSLLLVAGSLVYNDSLFNTYDLSTDVSFLLEELDSDLFIHVGED